MRSLLLLLGLTLATPLFALQIQSTTQPNSVDGHIKVIVNLFISETDLLFVVDNSGSMNVHQSMLSQNVPLLTQEISSRAGVAINAAVLTTSFRETVSNPDQGKFRKILRSSSPTFAVELAEALKVGIDGDYEEMPFAAVQAALSSPLIETENAGFLRPSAHLAVIFLTDAEDQSRHITVDSFATFLTDLKGASGVSAYAFMSPIADITCHKDNSNNTQSTIEPLVSKLGGQAFNICAPDWTAPMRTIAEQLKVEVTRTIRLPTEPVTKSIEVRFGNKILPAGDLHRGWVYDVTQNAILLGDRIDWNGQAPGAQLEITFVPLYWQP